MSPSIDRDSPEPHLHTAWTNEIGKRCVSISDNPGQFRPTYVRRRVAIKSPWRTLNHLQPATEGIHPRL